VEKIRVSSVSIRGRKKQTGDNVAMDGGIMRVAGRRG